MPDTVIRPDSYVELCAAVRENRRIMARGGGTKPALSAPRDSAAVVDLTALTGITEYEPGEFTFTACAGTPLIEINRALTEHGQYLPFDPPLVAQGATIGGTVASGLSGPGRYRYGGVRDFITGVRFVNGDGELVRAGGKVVKNAAGFDIAKLMVGSLGSLGVLAELSFKVFPRLPATATIRLSRGALVDALEALYRMTASQMDVDALDLVIEGRAAALYVRLAGLPEALPDRIARVQSLLHGGDTVTDEAEQWEAARAFSWVPDGWSLVKIPLTPGRVSALEQGLSEGPRSLRRYSAGGQVGLLALEGDPESINPLLTALGLPGLVIFGAPARVHLGQHTGASFARRVKQALDPAGKFVEA